MADEHGSLGYTVTITMDPAGQVSVSGKGADAAAVLSLLEVAKRMVLEKQLAAMAPVKSSLVRAAGMPAGVRNRRR